MVAGIFNAGHSGDGLLEMANCTFSGNSSTDGGALANDGGSGSARVVFYNSTLIGNSASQVGGGIYNIGTSGFAAVAFHNTILKTGSSGANIANSNGTISSGGYNLCSDDGRRFTTTGDQINTNPQLGPLENNGGPTLTTCPRTQPGL